MPIISPGVDDSVPRVDFFFLHGVVLVVRKDCFLYVVTTGK